MQKTLESFIDPTNIPKKYGGQLEFEFGDFPVLDPAIQNIAQWADGKDNFPQGPMYWVDKTPGVRWEDGKGGEKIKAIAVGSVGEKQRQEEVCTVTRQLTPLVAESSISYADEGGFLAARPELLHVPTATNSINETLGTPIETHMSRVSTHAPGATPESVTPPSEASGDTSGVTLEINGKSEIAVQDGKLVPASRPEPIHFVTASEGIQTLSMNDKPGNQSSEPPVTTTANVLDPNIEPPPPVPGPGVGRVQQ